MLHSYITCVLGCGVASGVGVQSAQTSVCAMPLGCSGAADQLIRTVMSCVGSVECAVAIYGQSLLMMIRITLAVVQRCQVTLAHADSGD